MTKAATIPKPVITLLRDGGYGVGFSDYPELYGTGATIPAALQALSIEIARHYGSEKGDETAQTQDAMRQTDILSNDRFIRGSQLQQSVLMAVALGFI